MEPVVIIGCGDVGVRVGRQLTEQGRAVVGVVRSPASVARLEAQGITAQRADLDDPAQAAAIRVGDRPVIYLAQPPQPGITDPRMDRFLSICRAALPSRIVYISTTGVYGDQRGARVTEETPTAPRTDRARRRMDAEQRLRAFMAESGVPVIILRVPGIYGPGRLPLERIRNRTPVVCADEAPPGNRIHAEDLAAFCIAALDRGQAGDTFNVSDGEHVSMTDFIYTVADLAGLPRPPCVPLAEAGRHISPAMMSFIRESRIIDTAKARRALGVRLRYPDIVSGIQDALSRERPA